MSENDWQSQLSNFGTNARAAARKLALVSAMQKNRCLENMARLLGERQEEILQENAKDLEHGQAAGLNAALLDRLRLTPARIEEMAKGLRALVGLPDPI